MILKYKTFEEFGENASAIQDYYNMTANFDSLNKLANIIIYDTDKMDDIKTVLNLAVAAQPKIIMIELCHLSGTQENIDKVMELKRYFAETEYTDMESYDFRLTYGYIDPDYEALYENLRLEYNELVDKYNKLEVKAKMYEDCDMSEVDFDEEDYD